MMEKAKRVPSIINAKTLSLVVLAAAIFVSGYLSYLKFDYTASPVCIQGGVFDCGTVLNSSYSEIADIPIAYLGLATNLLVVTLLLLEGRNAFFREYGATLIFGVVFFATVFSVYLIYIQAFRIEAFCPWCLTHEALIFVLFGLSVYRLVRHLNAPFDDADMELEAELQPQ